MENKNQRICGTCTACGQNAFYAMDDDITAKIEQCDICDAIGTWIDSDDYFPNKEAFDKFLAWENRNEEQH